MNTSEHMRNFLGFILTLLLGTTLIVLILMNQKHESPTMTREQYEQEKSGVISTMDKNLQNLKKRYINNLTEQKAKALKNHHPAKASEVENEIQRVTNE